MKSIDRLREQAEDFLNRNGVPPALKVSPQFWKKHPHELSALANKGYNIEVLDELQSETNFMLVYPSNQHPTIENLIDLRDQANKLIAEGKGHWPVHFLPHDAECYLQIKLCPIIPGQEPAEGLQLRPDFASAPEGEHILVLFGQDDIE